MASATMEIRINGDAEMIGPGECTSMGQLLVELRVFLANNQLAITRLSLDGEELSGEREAGVVNDRPDEYESLDIRAVGVHGLALSILDGARKLLPSIGDNFVQVAGGLIAGRQREALSLLEQGLDACSSVIQSFEDMRKLFTLDLGAIQLGDESMAQKTSRMHQFLLEIGAAISIQDMVTVSDLLEYELSPLIETWQEATFVLEKLIREDARIKGLDTGIEDR